MKAHRKRGCRLKQSRYSVTKIMGILKEAEAGVKVGELCRKYGMSDATYYTWKAKYGGMTLSVTPGGPST